MSDLVTEIVLKVTEPAERFEEAYNELKAATVKANETADPPKTIPTMEEWVKSIIEEKMADIATELGAEMKVVTLLVLPPPAEPVPEAEPEPAEPKDDTF